MRTEHQLIEFCELELRDSIISEVNKSIGFSILVDEISDIAGVEQLSFGVQFFDEAKNIREEFVGFVKLFEMDAKSISSAILNKCVVYGLDMSKLIGRIYDGCATMDGKETGVQVQIKNRYPNATYVHCAFHRLNLVVNDLNIVAEVPQTIGLVKSIITFFERVQNVVLLFPQFLFCQKQDGHQNINVFPFSQNILGLFLIN